MDLCCYNTLTWSDHAEVQKKLNGLKQQLDVEKKARMDLEARTRLKQATQSAGEGPAVSADACLPNNHTN